MKILYYDCFMGISGDMNLAAMLDLGVDKDHLLKELKKLHLHGYDIQIVKGMKNGIHGTKVTVNVEEEHQSVLQQAHHHHHGQRGMKEIRKIIESSALSEKVKTISLKIFNVIAEAEGKIHNKPVDEVHFHEVGAVDSIVDIVGAAICLDFLKPDRIIASQVQLGGGMVKCAHGVFPVPAPATMEILKGKPVKQGAVQFETTTPTGAAILAATADEFVASTELNVEKIGYGLGHKEAEVPNVLRVFLASGGGGGAYKTETQWVVETNIDDMSPESYEAVMEMLFAAGAADVTLTPVIMKKSRPAITLSAICSGEKRDAVAAAILTHTTTIGVRYYEVTRSILDRKMTVIDTPYGKVNVKLCGSGDRFFKAKPEYDDCARIARENKMALPVVISELQYLANQLLKR